MYIQLRLVLKNLNINSQNIYFDFLCHLEGLIFRINNIINFTKIPHKWIIFNEEVVYWENLLDVQRDEFYFIWNSNLDFTLFFIIYLCQLGFSPMNFFNKRTEWYIYGNNNIFSKVKLL